MENHKAVEEDVRVVYWLEDGMPKVRTATIYDNGSAMIKSSNGTSVVIIRQTGCYLRYIDWKRLATAMVLKAKDICIKNGDKNDGKVID